LRVTNDLISSYFFINKRIGKTVNRNQKRKHDFYNQTLVTRSGFIDEQPATISFNVENRVIEHVTAVQMAEQHIKILKFKQHYFKRFLDSLDTTSRNYYKDRYKYEIPTLNDRLDKLILEEITEIEEAAAHCFKKDKKEIFLVDPDKPDEQKLEDFSKMLELLGV
jgi:hypothetical protein